MKTFGKIIICILIILVGVGIATLIFNNKETNSTDTSTNITNNMQNNSKNELNNNITNSVENKEDTEYIGIEEYVKEPEEETTPDEGSEQSQEQPKEQQVELTGEEKAIDIVKKQYALEGQTVRFDHMEGTDYIIKLNDGTAVTWYIVDGETWEASEY